MGSNRQRVRRLTIHMNANSPSKLTPKEIDRSEGVKTSPRSSWPDSPLPIECQKRPYAIAVSSASIGTQTEIITPANDCRPRHTYNLRPRRTANQMLLNEVDGSSKNWESWQAKRTCRDPYSNVLEGPNDAISIYYQRNAHGFCRSYLSPTSQAESTVYTPLTPKSSGMYATSSDSSSRSSSPPSPQRQPQTEELPFIENCDDPVLAILSQMEKQISKGISKILSQARRRRHRRGEGGGGTRRGSEGTTFRNNLSRRRFTDMRKLNELAGSFMTSYRSIEENFVQEYACLGILGVGDEVTDNVGGFERCYGTSSLFISAARDEIKVQGGNNSENGQIDVVKRKPISIDSKSTIIDLQD